MFDALLSLNWFQPTWDLFIILFFVIAALVYGISLGRDRILVILVAIYMALAVVKYLPFLTEFSARISVNDAFAFRVSIFLGLFILLFFFLSQSALLRTFASGAAQGSLIQVIVYSVLHVGLLISVTLSFFPQDLSGVLSPLTQTLFLSDAAKAVWIITPLLAMAIFGRGKKD
jgi:hypothetical protein